MSTLIFFNIPAQGHLNPSLPLVAELARRGERVIYYNTEPYRAKVEAAGALFRSYGQNYEFEPGQDAAGPFKAMVLILGAGEALLPGLLEQVRADRPDYILYDSMCPWGKQIAQLLGLPAICSCSIFYAGSQNFKALPRDLIPPLQLLRRAPTLVASLWRYRQIAGRLRRRFGVPSPDVLDFFGNPGDITLVYTSRYFQIGAEYLDDSFKFVGPSIAPRNDHADFPFEHLEGGPVIYISLGTLFNDRPDFFRACLAAFGSSRYRVVMSIGTKVRPEALGAIPENVLVRPHLPQLEILAKAALFITHGGMNSASESAWFGVPMVAVPQVGDQLVVARRVAQLGAGLWMDPNRFTPQTLREAAEKVLADGAFRRQSQRLGASLRDAGGYVRAADEVLAFKETRERRETKEKRSA
jgi:MGT family glycosyltransferase